MFSADLKAKECETIIQSATAEINKLRGGVQIASKELERYETGSAAVDFGPATALANLITSALEICRTNSAKISQDITKLKGDVKASAAPTPPDRASR